MLKMGRREGGSCVSLVWRDITLPPLLLLWLPCPPSACTHPLLCLLLLELPPSPPPTCTHPLLLLLLFELPPFPPSTPCALNHCCSCSSCPPSHLQHRVHPPTVALAPAAPLSPSPSSALTHCCSCSSWPPLLPLLECTHPLLLLFELPPFPPPTPRTLLTHCCSCSSCPPSPPCVHSPTQQLSAALPCYTGTGTARAEWWPAAYGSRARGQTKISCVMSSFPRARRA